MTDEICLTEWIRVSSVLGMLPTMGSDGIWGYPMQKIDPDVLQRKAALGTNVHAAIAAHIKSEFFVLSESEQGYLDSYLRWEESIQLTCHQVEARFFYDPMNLTGCVDMIGKINPNGLYHIIDFKCTVSPDHRKWALQGAFYELLARSNGMTLDKRCLFVQLDPKGGFPKVHEYEITQNLTSMAISIYNTYLYLTEN